MQTNYTAIITSARAAARDILRTEKVSALLGFIRNQKAKISSLKKSRESIVTRFEKSIAKSEATVERAAYNLKLAQDTNNPDVADFKTSYENAEARHNDYVGEATVRHTRDLEDFDVEAAITTKAVEEKIAEYEAKIADWDNGKSKVDFAEMVSLANSLAAGRVKEAFNAGEYDNAPAEDDSADTAEDQS